jgi:hypothetical protein
MSARASPDRLEQFGVAERAAEVQRQLAQEVVFLRRRPDRLAGQDHGAQAEVDLQRARLHHRRRAPHLQASCRG